MCTYVCKSPHDTFWQTQSRSSNHLQPPSIQKCFLPCCLSSCFCIDITCNNMHVLYASHHNMPFLTCSHVPPQMKSDCACMHRLQTQGQKMYACICRICASRSWLECTSSSVMWFHWRRTWLSITFGALPLRCCVWQQHPLNLIKISDKDILCEHLIRISDAKIWCENLIRIFEMDIGCEYVIWHADLFSGGLHQDRGGSCFTRRVGCTSGGLM